LAPEHGSRRRSAASVWLDGTAPRARITTRADAGPMCTDDIGACHTCVAMGHEMVPLTGARGCGSRARRFGCPHHRLWPIKVTGAMGDVIAWQATIVCAIEAAVGSCEPSRRPRRAVRLPEAEVPKERWTCYRCDALAVMLS